MARTFKGNNAVIFDLFNEPFPDRATGSQAQGWRDPYREQRVQALEIRVDGF